MNTKINLIRLKKALQQKFPGERIELLAHILSKALVKRRVSYDEIKGTHETE